MKRLMLILFTFSGLVASAEMAKSPSHPLESVVLNLAETAKQLAVISEKTGDSSLKVESKNLQQAVSAVEKRALLAPIVGLDEKLGSLGFKLSVRLNEYSPDFDTNENYDLLMKETYARNNSKWLELKKALADDVTKTSSVKELVDRPEVASALYDVHRDLIKGMVNSRGLPLEGIQERADAALKCMTYYSQAPTSSGLRVISGANGFSFSSQDLLRVYRVNRIEDLSQSQRVQVGRSLKEMMEHASSSGMMCISRAEYSFLLEKFNSLHL